MSFIDAAVSAWQNSVIGGVSNGLSKFSDPSYWYEQNRADNISEENRNFQREMTEKSYKYALENWQKEFEIESNWNKASNQVSLMRAAGINPAVSQAAMNGTINMPSAVGGHATAPQSFEGVSHSDTSFMNVARGVNSSLVNDKTKALINSEIAKNISDSNLADAYTDVQNFALSLEKQFGAKLRQANLDKLIQDTAKVVSDIATNKELQANYSADTMNKMLQGPLLQAKRKLTEAQYNTVQTELKYLGTMLEAKIKQLNASSGALQSETELNYAHAFSENEFRQVRYDILGIQKRIYEVERDVKDATAMQSALADLQSKQWINKKLVEEVRMMYKQNRYEDVKEILRCIDMATDAYLNMSKSGYFQTESINNIIGSFMSASKNAGVRSAASGIFSSPSNTFGVFE